MLDENAEEFCLSAWVLQQASFSFQALVREGSRWLWTTFTVKVRRHFSKLSISAFLLPL
jgi:hypothetical protein